MQEQKNYLCFDLGGTFIKYGVVSSDGKLHYHDKMPTGVISSVEYVIEKFLNIYKQLSSKYSLSAIGISSHGVVDVSEGVIACGSSYVDAIVGQPLAKVLSQYTKLDVVMENDVNAAALGELWQGGLRQCTDALFLAFGTSIGGALIINGKIYRGINNAAGEAGYILTHAQSKSKFKGY